MMSHDELKMQLITL